MLRWNSSEHQERGTVRTMPTPQSLNITGLPFAGHFYKVTVTARAHYLGKARSQLLQTNDTGKFNARHVSLFQTKGLISMPVILSGLASVLISVPAVLSDMMCPYFSACMLCCLAWHVSLFQCLTYCQTWCVSTFQCLIYC